MALRNWAGAKYRQPSLYDPYLSSNPRNCYDPWPTWELRMSWLYSRDEREELSLSRLNYYILLSSLFIQFLEQGRTMYVTTGIVSGRKLGPVCSHLVDRARSSLTRSAGGVGHCTEPDAGCWAKFLYVCFIKGGDAVWLVPFRAFQIGHRYEDVTRIETGRNLGRSGPRE